MQDLKPSTICDQAQSLNRAYHHLQSAYLELAQTYDTWNEEADAYLREEVYLDVTAKDFVAVVVDTLQPMQRPMQELAIDSTNLCNDLLRVGRGESFSV